VAEDAEVDLLAHAVEQSMKTVGADRDLDAELLEDGSRTCPCALGDEADRAVHRLEQLEQLDLTERC